MNYLRHIRKISILKHVRILLLIGMFFMPLHQSHGFFPVDIFIDIWKAVEKTPEMIANIAQMALDLATSITEITNIITIISESFSELVGQISNGFGIFDFDADDITAFELPRFE